MQDQDATKRLRLSLLTGATMEELTIRFPELETVRKEDLVAWAKDTIISTTDDELLARRLDRMLDYYEPMRLSHLLGEDGYTIIFRWRKHGELPLGDGRKAILRFIADPPPQQRGKHTGRKRKPTGLGWRAKQERYLRSCDKAAAFRTQLWLNNGRKPLPVQTVRQIVKSLGLEPTRPKTLPRKK